MSIYDDLPELGPMDIRLLKISSRKATSAPSFHCSLIITSMEKAIEYAALSCTWGSPTPVESISCNGHMIGVTPNLISALTAIQDLGNTESDRYLWVDAICIDQSNAQERGAQVAMMKQIHSNAVLVYAWLGESSDSLEGAVKLIRKLNNAAVLRANEPDLNTAEIAMRAELPPIAMNSEWEELHRLYFTRPWFERIWTIQELCHARTCLVLNGRIALDWKELENIAPLFSDYQYAVPGRWNVYSLLHFSRIRSCHSKQRSRSLLDLLQSLRRQQASNDRDKVYAVLNLSTSRAVSMNIPDYTLSTAEVYKTAAQSLIFADTKERNLDVLCAVHPIKNPGWPSWIPDWSRLLNILAEFNGDKSKTYNSSKGTVARASMCPNQEQLIINGFRLDTVKVVALPMLAGSGYIPLNSISSNAVAQCCISDWILLALEAPSYPTGETLDDVLCQTLVAGKGFTVPSQSVMISLKGLSRATLTYERKSFTLFILVSFKHTTPRKNTTVLSLRRRRIISAESKLLASIES